MKPARLALALALVACVTTARLPMGARRMDGGAWALNGFHDAHIHLLSGGLAPDQAQLGTAETLDDALAKVRAYAEAHRDRAWVVGRGWSYDITPPGSMPTAAQLDEAVSDRPAALEAYDGHTLWLNSAAIKAAHLEGKTEGALLEDDMDAVDAVMPQPTRAEKKRALEAAMASCLALGITSVEDIESDLDVFSMLREIAGPLRVALYLPIEGDMDAYVAMRAHNTDRVQVVGVKGFVDGVVESKTAFMLAPYEHDTARGAPLIAPHDLDALVVKARDHGLRVKLHAIGDAAVRLSLDAFEHAHLDGFRGSVEHIEVIDAADVPRFRVLQVVASMQPYHAIPSDNPDTGAWSENLGPARRARSFAWRTLLDAGAVLRFGSDWPVFTHNPLEGVAVAVTRQNQDGLPVGGWNPHERIALDEALRAYSPAGPRGDDVVTLPLAADLEKPATLWGKRPARVVVDGRVVASTP